MLVGRRSSLVELIERIVKLLMPEDPCHGVVHVLRVRDLALRLGEAVPEPVDREILEIAALLHDIGRVADPTNHAERSAEIARLLLELSGYPRDRIGRVVEAILAHSYSGKRPALSIEAKVLSDADKLDALGAIGIARVFAYGGRTGRSLEASINHFHEKILKLKEFMYTSVGRAIAEERHRFVEEFLERLYQELETKD